MLDREKAENLDSSGLNSRTGFTTSAIGSSISGIALVVVGVFGSAAASTVLILTSGCCTSVIE
ncbi:MAG: hypothetical protein ACRC6O_06980 [Flavobacterium sp.]